MKQRLISLFFILLVAVPAVYFGGLVFNIVVLLLGNVAIYELLRLNNYPKYVKYVVHIIFCLLLIDSFNSSVTALDLRAAIVVLLMLWMPLIIYQDFNKYNFKDVLTSFGIVMIIYILFSTFIAIRYESMIIFIYVVLISSLTDTFAYIFGRLFGKHKLIPIISPNKTVEGLLYGTILGTILPFVFYALCIGNKNTILILLMTLVLSVFGSLGDLMFSAVKRNYKIKDFSNIIPGHGGILDRLDSLLVVCMVYTIIKIFI